MSPGNCTTYVHYLGFPRVSGDEPFTIVENGYAPRFSPRERG